VAVTAARPKHFTPGRTVAETETETEKWTLR